MPEGGAFRPGIDCIGVGVGAVIVDGEGRLLAARRGPAARNERGLWEFPGGTVEFGEQLEDALRREMDEELGIGIEVGELLDVVSVVLDGGRQHWISPAFLCRIVSGVPSIREPDKCTAIGWFLPDEMPAELTQVTRQNLEHYLARLETQSS